MVFTSFDDASKQDKEQKELVLPDLAGGNAAQQQLKGPGTTGSAFSDVT